MFVMHLSETAVLSTRRDAEEDQGDGKEGRKEKDAGGG